jgi:hypothetical protein
MRCDSAGAETGGANELPLVPQPPRQLVKVGDYVQWTNDGKDQFPTPRRINWVSEDGAHARVFGSMTGIPTRELTVVDPPPTLSVRKDRAARSSNMQNPGVRDINVMLIGDGRLQITAEVDKAGLSALKKMLDKYAEILDLLEDTSETVWRPPLGEEDSQNS